MPTALERTGDFSKTLVQGVPVTIYDPRPALPFPGNQIPGEPHQPHGDGAAAIFSQSQPAVRRAQLSDSVERAEQYAEPELANHQHQNRQQDTIIFAVGFQNSSTVTPNLFQFIDTGSGRGINANVAWSRTFTARTINNLRYNFSQIQPACLAVFRLSRKRGRRAGHRRHVARSQNWGPPNLSFTNYGSLTDGNYSLNRNQTSAVGDSLTWIRGMHNFTFGGDYRRQQFNQLADNNGRGTYTFNGSATSLMVNGVAQSGTGYDLADFLLGLPTTSSHPLRQPGQIFPRLGFDLFANDDWRIAPQLTLISACAGTTRRRIPNCTTGW